MNQNQLELDIYDVAVTRRDIGIARAVDKADRDQDGWKDEALLAVRKYLAQHPGQNFLTEDVRAWCETMRIIEAPENERAWGAIMCQSAKDGHIRKIGYAPARSSNLSPKVLWEPA